MVSLCIPALARLAQRTSQLQILLVLLAVICVPLAVSAASSHKPDAPRPSVESSTEEIALIKNPKMLEKYDIQRIGQRGIGHGFNIYSRKREHELGENMAAALDHTTKIITDPVVNNYVNRLAQRLVRYSDADIPFSVKVIDYGDMARAIAHVAARHATRALTRKEVCHTLDQLAYVLGPAGAGFADVGGLVGPLSVKKFSRDSEYEADLLGMEYAYAAGYDPEALV